MIAPQPPSNDAPDTKLGYNECYNYNDIIYQSENPNLFICSSKQDSLQTRPPRETAIFYSDVESQAWIQTKVS